MLAFAADYPPYGSRQHIGTAQTHTDISNKQRDPIPVLQHLQHAIRDADNHIID